MGQPLQRERRPFGEAAGPINSTERSKFFCGMWMVLDFFGGFSQSRSPLNPFVLLILDVVQSVGALSSVPLSCVFPEYHLLFLFPLQKMH